MNKLKFAAGASILVGTVFGCAATADATKPSPEHKVTICHSGNGKHFTEIEVDYAGALGHAKTDDDDIIPAFEDFPGQNVDKESPCSIQVTSTTQTTLITSTTTSVPVTTATTLPTSTTTETAPMTTVTVPTSSETTWLQTTSTTRPVTSSSPTVTVTTVPSSTLPKVSQTTTKAPATSVSPTTAPTSITATTPATEPTTSLPLSLSPLKQPEQAASLPVTGSNSFLLSVFAGAMIAFGAILVTRSKK